MCDFKPGDEVVCVDGAQHGRNSIAYTYVRIGDAYIIDGFDEPTPLGIPRVFLVGVDADETPDRRASFRWTRFRKVQRRTSGLTVEFFLTIKPGQFEEPKRTPAPAKKRERV